MIIALIGMSNIGKSHWSTKLESSGFIRFDCDDLIARAWKGSEFIEHDASSEQQYLDLEATVLQSAVDDARKIEDQNVVIDCTGSVIYLSPTLISTLEALATIVLLETPSSVLADMEERYRQFPKPLIWGSHTNYGELLAWRNEQYKILADIIIPYAIHRDPLTTLDQFLSSVSLQSLREG